MRVVVHPLAPEAVDPATPLWRYMALDRFVGLLHTRSLWFSRLDCFDDQWEGYTNDAALAVVGALGIPRERLHPIVEKLRVLSFVNCWTMHEHESSGLWDTFVKPQSGVVIRRPRTAGGMT